MNLKSAYRNLISRIGDWWYWRKYARKQLHAERNMEANRRWFARAEREVKVGTRPDPLMINSIRREQAIKQSIDWDLDRIRRWRRWHFQFGVLKFENGRIFFEW